MPTQRDRGNPTPPEEPEPLHLGAPTVSMSKRILEYVDFCTPEGHYTASELAEKTMAYIDEVEPNLLAAWLRSQGLNSLHDFISAKLHRERAQFYRGAKARLFAESADGIQNGDRDALKPFTMTYVVNDEQLRKRVRDMDKKDCLYVASRYHTSANRLKMLAAFHEALAKRLRGSQTIADVMDEETYTRLYTDIVGEELPVT